MEKIPVRLLAKEDFAPFGTIISSHCHTPERVPDTFDWYGGLADFNDIEHATLNLMTVYQREISIHKLECHLRTREAVIPLGGKGIIIPLSPPGPVTPETVAAFYVPGDKAVVFHPGTWHFVPYTLEQSAMFLTAYRRDTSKDDVHYSYLDNPLTLVIV